MLYKECWIWPKKQIGNVIILPSCVCRLLKHFFMILDYLRFYTSSYIKTFDNLSCQAILFWRCCNNNTKCFESLSCIIKKSLKVIWIWNELFRHKKKMPTATWWRQENVVKLQIKISIKGNRHKGHNLKFIPLPKSWP